MRQARRLERSNPIGSRGVRNTQVEVSSDEEILVRPNNGRHVVPRTMGELSLSVPAVGGSQRSQRLVLTSGTVGESQNTTPASPRALIAAGLGELDKGHDSPRG